MECCTTDSNASKERLHETLAIAGTAALLAAMTAVGVMGWWCIASELSALSLYIAFIAVFHMAEFFAVSYVKVGALENGDNLYDAFLLDNGMEYVWAVSVAAVEFAVEWSVCRRCKGFRFLRLVGIMMAVCGQLLRTWTIVHAGPSFTHLVRQSLDTQHKLVVDGPFARIRHPAYAGFFLWAAGLQVLLGNPVCLVGYVVVLVDFFGRRVVEEERALLERFGAEYISYRRRTVSGIPTVE